MPPDLSHLHSVPTIHHVYAHVYTYFIGLHPTFVTESLTLIAGVLSAPLLCILYRLWTPVVVSSVRPRISAEK